MLVADLDGFKAVNDRYGHCRGDEVLVAVARTLRAALRANDVVFRYGGDEFVVLLPETGRPEAEAVAARLSQAVRGLELPEGLRLTLSTGVAVFPDDAADEQALFTRADQAMYRMKAACGDR